MNATAALAAFPAATSHAAGSVPAWRDVAAHRAYLVRFARRHLADPMLAEDAVHDVFEAVLAGRAVFAGRSALRSWLTGILKHKIVDLVRQRAGFDSLDTGHGDDDEDNPARDIECPQPLPDEIAAQRERLAHTLQRIDGLPEGLRKVIELRVLQDLPTQDVCRKLAISEENLFVRLHRARKQLLA